MKTAEQTTGDFCKEMALAGLWIDTFSDRHPELAGAGLATLRSRA